MRYIISGKNLDITEGLRSAVTEKLGKLERYFTPDTEVHVTLSVEKERQKIEVTIPVENTALPSGRTETDCQNRKKACHRIDDTIYSATVPFHLNSIFTEKLFFPFDHLIDSLNVLADVFYIFASFNPAFHDFRLI